MIGQKISIIRACRGFSQEYMATKLGVKQNTYSGYEQEIKLNEDLLVKISEILGVSVEDIKSPMPIFMSFNSSPNSYWVNSSNNNLVQKEIIDEFISIIKKKDLQVDDFIIIIKKKDEQMDKLIDKLK